MIARVRDWWAARKWGPLTPDLCETCGRRLRLHERREIFEAAPILVDPDVGVGGGGIAATFCATTPPEGEPTWRETRAHALSSVHRMNWTTFSVALVGFGATIFAAVMAPLFARRTSREDVYVEALAILRASVSQMQMLSTFPGAGCWG